MSCKYVGVLSVKYLAWRGKVKVSMNKNYLKTQNNESVLILSEFYIDKLSESPRDGKVWVFPRQAKYLTESTFMYLQLILISHLFFHFVIIIIFYLLWFVWFRVLGLILLLSWNFYGVQLNVKLIYIEIGWPFAVVSVETTQCVQRRWERTVESLVAGNLKANGNNSAKMIEEIQHF